MFGVNSANTAITKLANKAALNAEKKIAQKALTKGTIYPIVKRIAGYLGVKITKDTFAKGVGKIIPIIGGVISGGLTLITFLPMARRLNNCLKKLPTADVEFYKENHDDIVIEINSDNIENMD